MSQRRGPVIRYGCGVSGALLLMLASCAGDPPKPAPTVTPEQVRTHADKAFEKLKQEEQSRSADPTVPRY
jgi:ABC-type transporter MlaC component